MRSNTAEQNELGTGRTFRLVEQRWVARAQDETFLYTADFSNIAGWDPGVDSATKKTAGEVGVGTEYDLMVNFGSSTMPMVYEITQYDPYERVVLVGRGEKLLAVDEIRFSWADNMTVIDYTADLTFYGAIRYLGPLMNRPLRRVGERALDGLASALEE